MEEDQNTKFKKMFNSIEDAVVVVQAEGIKFMNSYAKDIVEEEDIFAPSFFLFSDANDNQEVKRTKATESKQLSIKDILAFN